MLLFSSQIENLSLISKGTSLPTQWTQVHIFIIKWNQIILQCIEENIGFPVNIVFSSILPPLCMIKIVDQIVFLLWINFDQVEIHFEAFSSSSMKQFNIKCVCLPSDKKCSGISHLKKSPSKDIEKFFL